MMNFDAKINWLQSFLDFDVTAYEKRLREKSEEYWQKKGEENALQLFHLAAERVPAYGKFLKENGVKAESVKTIRDFEKVPVTDKENYIKKYNLADRCWGGSLPQASVAAVSSGTMGEPTYWPRGGYQEYEAGIIHELIYRYLFEIDEYRTLAVVGFPMGVYVSGVATMLPSWMISAKGYDITCVSTGINKLDVLRAVKNLRDEYDQVVLIGHPFFIKDVIETGRADGLDWSKKRLRLMFCSEGINEEWRSYVMEQAGIKESDRASVINTYGSSEMLLMGHETPFTIFLRRMMEGDGSLSKKLTGEAAVPNVFQYNPAMRYIEAVDDNLVFTSASGIPLIRFNMKDRGRVLPLAEVEAALGDGRPGWQEEFEKLSGRGLNWKLPLVTLNGRTDHTVTFYGANIYPENIKAALCRKEYLGKLTGKFTMKRGYLKNMDQFLEINVELRPDVESSQELLSHLGETVVMTLQRVNMEYLFLCNNLNKNLMPQMKLWPYQYKKYFKPGLKPKYIA